MPTFPLTSRVTSLFTLLTSNPVNDLCSCCGGNPSADGDVGQTLGCHGDERGSGAGDGGGEMRRSGADVSPPVDDGGGHGDGNHGDADDGGANWTPRLVC